MTTDSSPRSATKLFRLPARSAVAGANVKLARTTLADLEEDALAAAAVPGRVLTRLRRLVAGETDGVDEADGGR